MNNVKISNYYRDKVFLKFPQLETERFILTQIDESYIDDLSNLFSDEEVMKYSGMEVADAAKQAKMYIEKVKDMYENKKAIRWGIRNKLTNDFIGEIGLYNMDMYSNHTEIGYTVAKKYWRQGVATESIKAILSFAIENMNMNRVIAMIDKNNIPSVKLVEKLQFYRDGILREHYYDKQKGEYISICVYSIIRKDIRG